MKLLTSITLGLITSASLFAQTTMCFKENHTSMATIESTVLDGGLCSSAKSVQDMKKEGWSVDDIKIEKSSNGNNYIYIFKKDEVSISSIDMEKLEAQILKRLELKEESEAKAAIEEKRLRMSQSGKKMYETKCQNCHGVKGEELPGNSRALNEMSLFDFKQTIADYNNGSGYDRGTAFQMLPYANIMNASDISNVYLYLQAINGKKEESK